LTVLEEKSENLKSIEKKFIVMECFIEVIKVMENRQNYFQTLLPNILRCVNLGVEKFAKIKNDYEDNTEEMD